MLSIILPIEMEEVGISGENHRPVYKQFAKPITLCFIKFISARNRINGLHTNILRRSHIIHFFKEFGTGLLAHFDMATALVL